MPVNVRKFSFKALRRAYTAERNTVGLMGELWEIEVLRVNPGDYHKPGDIVIIELVA